MELDFEDVLLDIDISDLFTITRRPEVVTNMGRSSTNSNVVIENVAGIVCMASPNDLERLPEADLMKRYISVVSKFQLRGVSKEAGQVFKSDLITWKGNQYLVETVDPYGHVGSGFVQVIAGSVDIVDEAPSNG